MGDGDPFFAHPLCYHHSDRDDYDASQGKEAGSKKRKRKLYALRERESGEGTYEPTPPNNKLPDLLFCVFQ